MMDEISDLKADLGKRLDEPVAVSHKLNVCIMNMYVPYVPGIDKGPTHSLS